ncbi:glycosyltransferase family 1 protein [Microcella daejeonensis]|uniref:Glycosyltransferase family 1 protein n=1 Tax=Microcella daejeonensis TaxID=2994971 RepID=A0A9E8MLL7_9MICO|nr:glycosyltransferase family 1 protein [Microcella daejeonensis]WAB81885.1 glycosyltransferase family 1 protein [Microcella daejeonensis]
MSATTLRVVLDQVGSPEPSGVGRYSLELVRHLIDTAPSGCRVTGIVPSSPESEYARIAEELPGLSGLFKSALDRRQLAAAWQHGFTRLPGSGMIHAPSLFAPLYRHDRSSAPGEQIVVTIHDAVPWTHPDAMPARSASWARTMGRRAERYADAVVVPTHAVADQLSTVLDLGDRVRVIAGAVSPSVTPPADSHALASALDLPDRYVVAVGPFTARTGIRDLVWAMGDLHAPDVPLVLVGSQTDPQDELDGVLRDARLPEGRVRRLGVLSDAELAVVYQRAGALVMPSIAEGLALPALEAMSLGTPVVHSDAPTLLEVVADAGLVVPRDDASTFPRRLAESLRDLLADADAAHELAWRGRDRAKAFTWRDAAEKTWQLHADL